MDFGNFELAFAKQIRVGVNWRALRGAKGVSVDVEVLSSRDDEIAELYAPWYKGGTFGSEERERIAVWEVAQMKDMGERSRGKIVNICAHVLCHGAPPAIVVPAIDADDSGGLVLLDGIHRITGTYLAREQFVVMACVLHVRGPLAAAIFDAERISA